MTQNLSSRQKLTAAKISACSVMLIENSQVHYLTLLGVASKGKTTYQAVPLDVRLLHRLPVRFVLPVHYLVSTGRH